MRLWPGVKHRATRELPSESGGLGASKLAGKPVENTHAHGTHPAAGQDGAQAEAVRIFIVSSVTWL